MKASPAKRYRKPNYPDKLEVLAAPGLLQEHVPSAWKRSAQVTGALAFLAGAQTSMLTGCVSHAPSKHATAKHEAGMVAPVFLHGEGRGSFGCVVVAPPAFLSEEEAAQIISDTLLTAKIYAGNQPYSIEAGPFSGVNADLYSPESKIAVEFISHDDYFKLGGKSPFFGTVVSYDFQAAAKRFGKKIRPDHAVVGVFYDPIERWQRGGQDLDARKKSMEDAKAKSKALLEAQVKDFIEWLKVQGAL